MTGTKEQVNRYTSKLYRFLEQGHKIEFKKMGVYEGWIWVDQNPTHVMVDPRTNILSVLIHESLHYFYPTASENWVLSMENKILHKLTHRQIRNIIRCLAKHI